MNYKVYFKKNGLPYRINVPRSKRDKLFVSNHRIVELIFNGRSFYTRLPDSFFDKCSHLGTAYTNLNIRNPNELMKWLSDFNIKEIGIEVLTCHRKFKLTKVK